MHTTTSLSIETVQAERIYAGNFVGNGALITDIVVSEDSLPAVIKADIVGNVKAEVVNANAIQINGENIKTQNVGCFLLPSSGISYPVGYGGGYIQYENVNGWVLFLKENQERYFRIRSYTMPPNPEKPFSGLPDSIEQRIADSMDFNTDNGTWDFNVGMKIAGSVSKELSIPVTIGDVTYGNYQGRSCKINIKIE
jgi:hypothetical protein